MKMLVSAAVLFMLAQPLGTGEPDIAGTYEILICRPACNPGHMGNVLVRGIVVLESAEFDPTDIPEADRKLFDYGYNLSVLPNGCFVLETFQHHRTYAGIDAVGFTWWVATSEGIRFDLYSSPDAGYRAKVKVTSAGLEGQGASWGAGSAAPGYGADFITGRRAGRADRSKCIEAARKVKRRANAG